MCIGYACLNIGTPNTNIRSVMRRNATPEKLTEVTAHNLTALEKMVEYNIANDIRSLPHQFGPDSVRFESGQCTRLAENPQGSLRPHRRQDPKGRHPRLPAPGPIYRPEFADGGSSWRAPSKI